MVYTQGGEAIPSPEHIMHSSSHPSRIAFEPRKIDKGPSVHIQGRLGEEAAEASSPGRTKPGGFHYGPCGAFEGLST